MKNDLNTNLSNKIGYLSGNLNEKITFFYMFEINCVGEKSLKSFSIRELHRYIQNLIKPDLQWQDGSDKNYDILSNNFQKTETFYQKNNKLTENTENSKPSINSRATELLIRDLRKFDMNNDSDDSKTILIRRHAIVFSLDPIQAVVMADRLIVLTSKEIDNDTLIQPIIEFLKGNLISN
jgi:hypothetical protein